VFLTFDRAAEIKETVYISNNSIVNTYVCLFQNLNANMCNIFEKKQEVLHFVSVVIIFLCVFCNLCTSYILFNISNFFLKVFALFQNMKLVSGLISKNFVEKTKEKHSVVIEKQHDSALMWFPK